jgi:hypothetical protein
MNNRIIVRPVFNRAEMLKLSIDYEIKAREYYDIGYDFTTIFIIENGATKDVLELVYSYPFNKQIIERYSHFGLSANILEGLKTAFDLTSEWVLYIEDDILLHETYFKYIDLILNMSELSKWSVISPYNFNDNGNVQFVRKDRHYAALAPIIRKYFFELYVRPCAKDTFYKHPAAFVNTLDELYKSYCKDRIYRYKTSIHHQQAGLINRLCDVARIEEGLYVVMPEVTRIQHIGFFGYNRPGGKLKGDTFEERLNYLKEIIKSSEAMYEASATKQYNDYKAFSPKLTQWDGTLQLAKKHFTS